MCRGRETMSRIRMLVSAASAAAAVAGLTVAGASGLAQASPQPALTQLAGSTAAFTSHTAVTGEVAGATRLSVELWLKGNVAAAAAYATAVSTPGNALFHHYLSPAAYTARFGASGATAGRVESWLRGQGFTAVHTAAQRSYVRATGTVRQIEAAFHTRVDYYRSSASVNAGRYTLRANAGALSLPASLAGSVLGVTGIDNAAAIQPMDRITSRPTSAGLKAAAAPSGACSQYYGENEVTGLPSKFGSTTFPTEGCGYTAGQLRAAYGANNTNTGKGVTVALVEQGLTKDMFLTLQDYAAANSMPAPSSSRYAELSLGKNTCGDPFDLEEQLDVEAAYDMAPGSNVLVVGGDSCNNGDFGLQGLFNADLAVIATGSGHPLSTIASNSWEGGTEGQPAQLTNVEHAYLVRAAAEGVGMYFSSGDGSGVLEPGSDPFTIGVGGTTLGIGASNNRLFETGWSTGISELVKNSWFALGEQGAAGGGPSLLWKEPSYQKGVVPPSLTKVSGNRGTGPGRSDPDISADADPFTGIALGLLDFPKGSKPVYTEIPIGGTSLASPLVAGIVTAAQQGQKSSFGFLNPALYKLGSSAFHATLPVTRTTPVTYHGTYCDADTCGAPVLTTFDDQYQDMIGYNGQVTLKGYDNMSGL